MPIIRMFRRIKIYMYWNDHMPPHFHAPTAVGGKIENLLRIQSLDECM